VVNNVETSGSKQTGGPPKLLRELWPELVQTLGAQRFYLFLDFDGTLTPVRKRPEWASLSPAMSARLVELASYMPLAIVSGRDRDDVESLVGVSGLFYAGCHGFDIEDPRLPDLPVLDGQCSREEIINLGSDVAGAIAGFRDVVLKVKQWAIAVHYRSASPKEAIALETILKDLLRSLSQFRIFQGDGVVEITPNVRWNKGEAVLWLGKQFENQYGCGQAIYIGDDTTDEDAFRALDRKGLTILVAQEPRSTSAEYRLADPTDVAWFLEQLLLLVRSPVSA
jgi:trehalose 6-phosphate phosphatase